MHTKLYGTVANIKTYIDFIESGSMITAKNPYRILGRYLEILSYNISERIAKVETLLLSEIKEMQIFNERAIQFRTNYEVHNVIFGCKKTCHDTLSTILLHIEELPDNSGQTLK